MNIRFTIRQYIWLLLLLTGCGASATATAAAIDTPVSINMNHLSTQIAGTVVTHITQTAYVTPSEILHPEIPTYTPSPMPIPDPIFSDDGKKKVFSEIFTNDNETTTRLGNLNNGHSQVYNLGFARCDEIKWSPDRKHFAVTNFHGLMGAVDGSTLIEIPGSFSAWIDATHYTTM